MLNLRAPKTLDEGVVVSKLGQRQNPYDKTLEEGTEFSGLTENCSDSLLPSEVSVRENGCGFDAKSRGIGVSNVEVLNRGNDIEKGMVGVEEDLINAESNVDVSISNSGSEDNMNKEVIFDKTLVEGIEQSNASLLNDVYPSSKIDVSRNGISIFVEVFGLPKTHRDEAVSGEFVLRGTSDLENGYGEDDTSLSNNEESPSANVPEIHDSVLGVMENGIVDREGKKGSEVQEEGICDQECEFSVGNLVWVRTKSQSWWPGVIIDPSYATKDNVKSDQRASLLVKYFGNGIFVWCSSMQLRPFIENFEQMSVQSNSRSFHGAVQKAVAEFGQRVKMQMSCSCILKENYAIPTCPLAVNTENKVGTLMLEDSICELGENYVTRFKPANFLAFLKFLAQYVSVPGVLEVAATQSRLSAFYRSMGHRQLPMHQLRATTDGKDGSQDGLSQSGFSVDTQAIVKNDQDLAKLSGGKMGIVAKKCGGDFAANRISSSSRKRKRNMDCEVGNGSAEAANICKLDSSSAVNMSKLLISPNTIDNIVSNATNDGGSRHQSKKGCKTRERRRSKYLSSPYRNKSSGCESLPISEENETEDCKGFSRVGRGINNTSGQSIGSPRIAKCSGKKLQKKWSRKAFFGLNPSGIQRAINASSSEMLSEIRSAALDCLYPNGSIHFDSAEGFFSGFRKLVFHDELNHEIQLLQTLPQGGVPMDKGAVETRNDPQERSNQLANATSKPRGTKKEVANLCLNTKPTPSSSDVSGNLANGSFIINFQELSCLAPDGISVSKKRKKKGAERLGNDPQERSNQFANATSKLRGTKKKEVANVGLNTKPTPSFSDVSGNPANGSFMINFQESSCLAPDGISVPKKRKKKGGRNTELIQAKSAADLAGLNGNFTTPCSFVEDSQATNCITPQDKPRQSSSPAHCRYKSIASLADVNKNNTKLSSFLKDVEVMGPCSTQDVAELNNREGMKGVSSICSNSKLTANETDTNGTVKYPGQMVLLFPGGKPEPKKRKRKEKAPLDHLKTEVTSVIPDLNKSAAECSSPGKGLPETNGIPTEGKPQRKRRRRNKHIAGIPDVGVNYNKLQTNEEAMRNSLLFKFAEGFPVPSKEALVATFCGFGPLNEPETQAPANSGSAQDVFINSSDAGDAFRSLEKISPSGPALVSHHLNHLSVASRALESDSNLRLPVAVQNLDGFKVPAKPSGMKPHAGEAPDLFYIRKNLEMMRLMLEKAGDNLSQEMRTKLETDIKSLMTKVSSMVGSSSS